MTAKEKARKRLLNMYFEHPEEEITVLWSADLLRVQMHFPY